MTRCVSTNVPTAWRKQSAFWRDVGVEMQDAICKMKMQEGMLANCKMKGKYTNASKKGERDEEEKRGGDDQGHINDSYPPMIRTRASMSQKFPREGK